MQSSTKATQMNDKELYDLLDSEVDSWPSYNGEVLNWLDKAKIEFQFSAIFQHIDFVEKTINQEQEKLQKTASDFVESEYDLDEEEKASLYFAILENASYIGYEYPSINLFCQIQYRSTFLVLYSYFEHILNYLCHSIQGELKTPLTLKDIHGQGIERAKTYLVKLAKIEKPFQTKYWQRAKLLSEIRNTIAHNNSKIKYSPEEEKTIYSRLNKENIIKIDQLFEDKSMCELILSYDFLKESIFSLKSVILDICDYKLYSPDKYSLSSLPPLRPKKKKRA